MEEELLSIRPLCFLEQETVNDRGDEIVVPRRVLEQWMTLYAPSTFMLATLTNPETESKRTVCINGSSAEEAIYVPSWIMEDMGYSLEGGEGVVFMTPQQDDIPAITKIYVRVLTPVPPDTDLRQAVETHLDRFHVLESGITLAIPVGSLEALVRVEGVEPMPLSLIGGEVLLEFIEDSETTVTTEETETTVAEETVVAETTESAVTEETEPAKPLTSEEIRLLRLKRFGVQ